MIFLLSFFIVLVLISVIWTTRSTTITTTTEPASTTTTVPLNKVDSLDGDLTMLIIGDSTSYNDSRWVYQLILWMINNHSQHQIAYRLWDDPNTVYSEPRIFGTGEKIISIYNASVPGSTANYLMAGKFNAMNNITEPNIIWWNHGKNHVTGSTMPIVEGELSSAVAQIQLKFPSVPIITTLQPPNLNDNNMDTAINAWKDIMTQLGDASLIVDVYSKFISAGKPATWFDDNVHPSTQGTMEWVNTITDLWPSIIDLSKKSRTSAAWLNTTAMTQFLFQGTNRYGDFSLKCNGSTPSGWTSYGPIVYQDSGELPNAVIMTATGTGTGSARLQRTLPSTILPSISGKSVYLSWYSNIQSGAVATVGRVGLSYNGPNSGTVTLNSRSRTDVQGGWYWQSIGPLLIPTDVTFVYVTIYQDSSATPDTTHSVSFQQITLSDATHPTMLGI